MRETLVWFLGWEDLLEKGKSTHSITLTWKIPWTIQSMGLQGSDMTERVSLSKMWKIPWFYTDDNYIEESVCKTTGLIEERRELLVGV